MQRQHLYGTNLAYIKIRMDFSPGANIKEEIRKLLGDFIWFFNNERIHLAGLGLHDSWRNIQRRKFSFGNHQQAGCIKFFIFQTKCLHKGLSLVGGNNNPKSLFEAIEKLGTIYAKIDVQVIYDSCRIFVDFTEEYEKWKLSIS